jgi:hypothetical protein
VHIKDKEVRRYQGDRSKDGMVEYALSGWHADAPELKSPLGGSPFSSSAIALGVALDAVLAAQQGYESVRQQYNLSHPVLLALCAIMAVLFGSILGTILSVIFPGNAHTTPRRHYADSAQAHGHSHAHAHTHGGAPCTGHGDKKQE